MNTTTTYYAQPAPNGGFILTSTAGYAGHVKTLKFARSHAEFAGAALIVLKKDGSPKN